MPIISISQGSQSGAGKLAKELSKRLGFRVVDQAEASAEARRYGVSEEDLHRGLDHPANFFERFTQRKQRYVLAMQATLGRLFADGQGIYCGLAGQFLFHGLCSVFKVRLVAPMEYRVATAMSQLGLDRDEAVRFIDQADERRGKWGRQIFGADVNDPDLYDLVVNLEHMDVDTAADMITGIIRRKDFPEDCDQQFQEFALERRIQAALYFNSPFNPDVVEVRVDNATVHLSGGRSFEEARTQIVDFVSRIGGVHKVVTDVGEVSAPDATLDLEGGLSTRDTTARDVMLSPENYPHCRISCSIREAIVALSASSVRLEDGHIMVPRYVLVLDEEEQLVGVVSRRELLKGLVPQLRRSRESEEHIKEFVPFGGHTPSELFIRWTSLFSNAALQASTQTIDTIMVPVRGAVQASDSLSTVVSTMLHHGVDLIPVLDGQRVAGVVLMTTVFDIVAQFILEHGGRAATGEAP